jgi:hypothetical protein
MITTTGYKMNLKIQNDEIKYYEIQLLTYRGKQKKDNLMEIRRKDNPKKIYIFFQSTWISSEHIYYHFAQAIWI